MAQGTPDVFRGEILRVEGAGFMQACQGYPHPSLQVSVALLCCPDAALAESAGTWAARGPGELVLRDCG